jgi:GntR family transcriptional regulator, transcriptional repressor for pyruvate dehydrogenase complex
VPVEPSGVFTPVRRASSFDGVLRQIEDAIVSRHYQNGDRLPNERDLSQALGVSRSTVREALRVLEVMGLVEIKLGATGGIFVTLPDGHMVGKALEALIRFRGATARELAEFRASFEGETTHWAAQRADGSDRARLDELAAEVRVLVADEHSTWAQIAAVDVQFHEAVATASKNQVRLAIMLGIYRALERVIVAIGPEVDAELRQAVADQLTAIATAIGAGDADRARSVMRHHVETFSRLEVEVQEREDARRGA